MLQSRSSYCKLNSSLSGLAVHYAVDQAAAKGIAAANTIDDVQIILFGEAVFIICYVVQHCAPAIVKCRMALTQGNGNHFKVKLISQLLGNRLVTFMIQGTAVNISSLSLNTKYIFCIFFVGNANINILAQIGHSFTSLSAGPQFAAIVQVTGDFNAFSFSSFAGLTADLNHVSTQGRGNTGKVEPLCTFKNSIPIKISSGS